jgi:hypothetical protein
MGRGREERTMTPLAHRIVKELTLPKAKRTFVDHGGILPHMTGAHCFDLSECVDLAIDLLFHRDGVGYLKDKALTILGSIQETTTFLPAELTWIEWLRPGTGTREGALMFDSDDRIKFISVKIIDGIPVSFPTAIALTKIVVEADGLQSFEYQIYDPGDLVDISPDQRDAMSSYYSLVGMMLHVFLSFINTPKIIGRRQHMPHRGLERKLIALQPIVGKFPLRAWTEIKLEVAVPKDLSEEAAREAHLTGRKALHFCRAHLRHWHGALVFVRPHWRGDAALGIKRSRYTVVPPTTGGGVAHA